ncbi:MAG: response regulator [Hungatella sp.]|jgi:signal transduction histidine kinase/CheY-like chemotaxis protein|nr:response regulator [Hungatella sp.]
MEEPKEFLSMFTEGKPEYIQTFYQTVSQNIDTTIFIVKKTEKAAEYVFENTDRLLGIPAEKFYHNDPSDTNELYGKIMEILRSERPKEQKRWEIECFNKTFGQTMWLSVTCSPVIFGTEEKYIFSFSNLTEERLIRRALSEAANAASQASAAKSRFLSNMSHDIRTPMNAIMGFAALAQKNIGDMNKVSGYLQKILSSGKLLLELMKDVLEMSLLESGKMVIKESENDLREIFQETYNVVSEEMEKRQLDFYMDLENIHNTQVICDSTHLNQILMNLLSNSMKFTPAGGSVTLTLSQADSSLEGWGNFEIRVKDTGIGISQQFLPRVFDSFEREVNSTVNKIPGTGLGMSITKAIVELMNGMIDVKSQKGQWTEFTVTFFFPLVQTHALQAEPDSGEDADFTNTRILLTEDNELNREIATEILTGYGFQIETAENGQIAVEMLSKSSPGYYDLILMDIQMPVMNGHQATRAIRQLEDPALSKTTIVAMTANAFHEDEQAALDCGMDGFITKPIDVDLLIKKLKQILG